MAWIELHIHTSADYASQLSDQLTLLGAEAVTFQDAGDQPIYEPAPGTHQFWHETIVIGLFAKDFPLQAILDYLHQQQKEGLINAIHTRTVADKEWERVCLEDFKPMHFGKRLWICPSWHTPPDPEAVNIRLDPGLAFGTGTHPTTALCLEWLDEHITHEKLVIDYGCGSGILALAALKLGAKQVYAVDNDPQALEATAQNGLENGVSPPILTTFFPSALKGAQADVLIANILAKPLIDLAEKFASLIKPSGKILLSGVLIEQIEEVKEAYAPWFKLDFMAKKDQWARISGSRK